VHLQRPEEADLHADSVPDRWRSRSNVPAAASRCC
jgi:hypothetical protein